MNIYKTLNEITLYIENHLDEKIKYEDLSKIMGVNTYTMKRIFSILVDVPIAEYIRKRRLSLAAYDLLKGDSLIIDIALKYGYENATSFSRAFEAFHGIKPSLIKKTPKIKDFPRKVFQEKEKTNFTIEYSIVNLPKLTLYGLGTYVDNETIANIAPSFFKEIKDKYATEDEQIKYGMVTYEDSERMKCNRYYCLFTTKIPNFEKIEIPSSKYLKFTINSQKAEEIQAMSHKFYEEFLPSCKYNLKDTPELEYYHDSITDFFVPIY